MPDLESVAALEAMDAKVEALMDRVKMLGSIADMLEHYVLFLETKDHADSKLATPLESGRHPSVPFPRASFLEVMFGIRDELGDAFTHGATCPVCHSAMERKTSFIDVGCGIGDKLLFSRYVGYEPHGLEVDPYLLRVMTERLSPRVVESDRYVAPPATRARRGGPLTLYPKDARDFDYSGFDVVFFYRPFKDVPLETILENRIWDTVKEGAFVIACAARTTAPATFQRVEYLNDFEPPENCIVYFKSRTGPRPTAPPATPEAPGPCWTCISKAG